MIYPSTTPTDIRQPSAPKEGTTPTSHPSSTSNQDMLPMSDLSRLSIPSNLPEGCDVKLLSQFLDRQMSRKLRAFDTILDDLNLLTCPFEDPWAEVTPRIPNSDLKVVFLELKIAMDAANASSALAAKVNWKAQQALLHFETLWQDAAAKFESTYSKDRLEQSKRETFAPRNIPIQKLSIKRQEEVAYISALRFSPEYDEEEVSFHVAKAQNKVLRDGTIPVPLGYCDLRGLVKAIVKGEPFTRDSTERDRPHHVDPTTIKPSVYVPDAEFEPAQKKRPLSSVPTDAVPPTPYPRERSRSARSSTPPPPARIEPVKRQASVELREDAFAMNTRPPASVNAAAIDRAGANTYPQGRPCSTRSSAPLPHVDVGAVKVKPLNGVVQIKSFQKFYHGPAALVETHRVPATPYPRERPSSARLASPPPAPSRKPVSKRAWEQDEPLHPTGVAYATRSRSRPQSQPMMKTTSAAPLARSPLCNVPSRAAGTATSSSSSSNKRAREQEKVPGKEFVPTARTYPTKYIPAIRASASVVPMRSAHTQTALTYDHENLPPLTLPTHMRVRPGRR